MAAETNKGIIDKASHHSCDRRRKTEVSSYLPEEKTNAPGIVELGPVK